MLPERNEVGGPTMHASESHALSGKERQVSSTPGNEVISAPTNQHEITQFTDEQGFSENVIVSNMDPTFTSDSLEIGGLDSFLSRPALIHEFNWVEGTPLVGFYIEPWHLFFNDPAIKRKIDNYAFISCKLHVKILINATPFLYGGVIASYEPLPEFGYNLRSFVTSDLTLSELSQAPHVWVLPQLNQGGEMELPFFYDTDWLELTSASDLKNMGRLHFYEASGLQVANGSVGQGTTISVYAWAEDVKLSGPTFDLAVQSGKSVGSGVMSKVPEMATALTSKGIDEYVKKPISSIASTVAAVAKPLSSVPVIGMFAKATTIGASAVSKIASLFGWTNPPVISDVQPYRHTAYHALSSAAVGVPADTFTLDPKSELCVDPRTVGLGDEDEMTFAYIGGKECYIGSFDWGTGKSPGSDLFNLPISCVNYHVDEIQGGYQYSMTPACCLSTSFKYWRGDVIVRLKFLASDYHRGRVRVTWDPKSNLNLAPANTTTSLNRVIDISDENDVEIRVPYNQARHWLEVPPIEIFSYLGTAGGIIGNYYNPRYFNGTLHGYVINSLSAPDSTASVRVLMFVRMAPNFELGVAQAPLEENFSYFPPQSGAEISISGKATDDSDQNANLVYIGDPVRSLRTVLRRSMPATTFATTTALAGSEDHAWMVYSSSVLPDFNGFDPTSPYDATAIITGLATPCTWVVNTPFTVMIPCYKAMRGSIMWHYEGLNTSLSENRLSYEIVRSATNPPESGGRLIQTRTGTVPGGATNSAISRAELFAQNPWLESGSSAPIARAGQTLKSSNQLEGASVLCPNMFNYRFDTTRPSAMRTGLNRKRSREDSIHVIMRGKPSASSGSLFSDQMIRRYYSVGPDFSAFFFLCTPRMYRYSSIPGPV